MDELRIDMLTTIIGCYYIDFPPKLVLNQGSKDPEEVKNCRLMFWEVNLAVPRKVIYEGEDLFVLSHGNMREWTKNVTMD